MKRTSICMILSLMLAVCLFLLPSQAEAATYSGTCGTDLNWTLDTATGELKITGSGAMTSWSSSSGAPWYNYRSYIKSVNLAEGVTTVGSYAFYNYTSLTKVTIPASLTSVASKAFSYCTSVSQVVCRGTYSNWLTVVFDPATVSFYYADGVVVPATSTYPESAHNYENSTNQTKTFTFSGAECLQLTFNSSTATESGYDFIYIYDGKGTQIIKYSGTTAAGKSVTVTGDTFKVKLTSDSSTVKYGYAFSEIRAYVNYGTCGGDAGWNLDNATGTLTITGSGDMFDYVSYNSIWREKAASVKSIVISKDITSIGNYAFENFTALEKVEYGGTVAAWMAMSKGTGNDVLSTVPVHCKANGGILLPSSTYPESDHPYTNNLDETKTFTYEGAKMLEITFSSSSEGEEDYDYIRVYDGNGTLVAKYDENAASKTLTIVGDTFKVNLETDESGTYYGYSFSKIVAYESFGGSCGDDLTWEMDDNGKLTITGSGAMTDYTSGTAPWYSVRTMITSVSIDSRVTHIGNYAFYGMSKLTSVTIPSGVTSIGNYAFYNCTGLTSVVIPDSVATVGTYAFASCSALTGVTIGAGVTTLGNYAFQYCRVLTQINFNATAMTDLSSSNHVFDSAGCWGSGITVNIGANVTKIPGNLFYPYANSSSYSPNITSVSFAQGSVCTEIGSGAFTYCIALASINLPDTLTSIGSSAFFNCSALTSVDIPAGVTTIGNNALYGCNALTGIWVDEANTAYASDASGVLYNKDMTVLIKVPGKLSGDYVLPETLTELPANAFQSCTGLTGITFGSGITSIPNYAFSGCTALTSVVIPDAVTSLGTYAFSGCTALKSVTFGAGITAIPERCFQNCTSLTSIDLPKTVTSVGAYAYYGCSGVTYLNLSWKVRNLGNYAFYNCTALTQIDLNAEALNNLSSGNYVFGYAGAKGTGITVNVSAMTAAIPSYLFCPYSSSSTYAPKITAVNIADGQVVRRIGMYTFAWCNSLTSFNTGDKISSIGTYAFYNCSALKTVTIGKWVESIGNYAFYNCTALTEINYNAATVANLGSSNYVFYKAGQSGTGITVNFGAGVKKVPSYLFYPYSSSSYSPKLTSVNFAENGICESIGSYAFCYCTSLTKANIAGCASVGSYAFSNCTALTELTIGPKVTSLSNYAFYTCTALTKINFNATAMNDLSGSNCVFYQAGRSGTGITVNIGANVTKIPAYLFYPYSSSSYSPKLAAVNFAADGVCESIGSYAFNCCSGFSSVSIPASVKAVGISAFGSCSGLTAVHTPSLQAWCGISFENRAANPLYIAKKLYVNGVLLTDLVIPYGTAAIGSYAFTDCADITYVDMPAMVTSIGEGAFYNCSGITYLMLPAGVNQIGTNAFYGCTNLAVLQVDPANATYKSDAYGVLLSKDGTRLLYAPRLLAGSYAVPEGVTAIAAEAFRDCKNLTLVSIPGSVANVGSYAFYNCSGLTGVLVSDLASWCGITFTDSYANPLYYGKTLYMNGNALTELAIPEGVETISSYAFYNGSFTSVALPKSLTAIEAYAFNSSTGLTMNTYAGTYEQWTAVAVSANNNGITAVTVKCLADGVTRVAPAQYPQSSHNYANNLDETKTFTWEGAKLLTITFSASTSVQSSYDFIYVYDGADTLIGSYTGTNAAGKTLTIPGDTFKVKLTSNASTTAYGYAFDNVLAYDRIGGTCGENMTWELADDGTLTVSGTGAMTDYGSSSAPWYTFRKSITKLVVGEGVTTVGNNAFYYYYDSLADVSLPSSLETIGSYAFYSCKGLTQITIPAGQISGNAFYNCTALTELTFREGVTAIAGNAFYGCTGLTEITIPASLVSIDAVAFQSCSGITAYSVSKDNAAYCSDEAGVLYSKDQTTLVAAPKKLSGSYTVADTVTVLGAHCFNGCSGLTEILLPKGITEIGTYAFYYCYNLPSVTIPEAVTNIGTYAFNGCSKLTEVRYGGTGAQWGAITIGTSNSPITTVNVFCEASNGWRLPTSSYIQSSHNYSSYTDETKTFTHEGAKMLTITFSDKTFVEKNTDYIYLYNNATGSYWKKLTGDEAAGKTFLIPGDTFRVQLTSNYQNQYYGYAFSSIVAHDVIGAVGEDGLAWTIDDAGVLTVSGEGPMADHSAGGAPWYVFRSQINSVVIAEGVTSVGAYAFYNCTGVTQATLPDSLTSIGSNAFSSCKLTSVTIPAKVTELGNAAIDCSTLTAIFVDEGNTVYASDASGVLFNKAMTRLIKAPSKLSGSYSIPEGVISIDPNAFNNSYALTAVTFPKNLTTIGDYAFSNCDGLAELVLPGGLTTLGTNAFYSCGKLASVTIPETLTQVGSDAFYTCSALTGVYITDLAAWCGVEYGNYYANPMWYAKKLYLNGEQVVGQLVIPESVTSVATAAFYGCADITSVTLPESLTVIGDYAFGNCTGLTAIDLPESLTTMTYGFSGCTGLTSVTVPGSVSAMSYAFDNCTGLTAVTLSQGVTSIGSYAFQNCTGLTSVTIPDSVTSLGSSAFYNCTGLTTVTFGTGLKTVGQSAFYNCAKLTSAALPNGLNSIGHSAFSRCSAMTMVSIPNTVKTIGSYAFDETGLVSVTIPDSVTSLGSSAFYNCTGLTYVSIGYGVKSIGTSTFSGCTALREVRAKNTVASIDTYAFNDCTNLIRVTGMDSVVYVKDYAFYNCGALKVFDSSCMSSVGDYAFYNCASLEKVFLNDYSGYIEQYAFYGCTALSQVTLHSRNTFYSNAFGNCPNIKTIYLYGWDYSYALYTWNVSDAGFSGITATVYYPAGCTLSASVSSAAYGTNCSFTFVQQSSGTCGYNANWSFDAETGILDISGTGGLCFVHSGTATPWAGIRDEILKVNIQDGIIRLPKYSFEYVRNATEIRLPNTLVYMAPNTFNDCESLNNLLIPASLREMESDYHFNRCNSLTDIYYVGTRSEWLDIPGATTSTYDHTATLHTLEVQASTATCTEPGKAAYYIFPDSEIYTQMYDLNKNIITEIPDAPATGHHYTEDARVEPTCTETGLTAGSSCEYCGLVEVAQEQIPALGHSPVDVPAVEPTLEQPGLTVGSKCEVCGEILVEQEPVYLHGIVVHPTNQTAPAGQNATFTVQLDYEGAAYRWQYSKDGGSYWANCSSSFAGYNTDTLTVNATFARDGFLYRCKITDTAGNVGYTLGACLTVTDSVIFEAHPQDETVKLGNRANFTVEASGDVKSIQWQYQMLENGPWWNCTPYTMGYNSSTLNVIAAEKREGFRYRCRITDTAGNKYYSESAVLSVDIPETYAVLSQPQNAYVMPGSKTTFHIDTQGEGLTYQWEYHKGVDKTGPEYYWIAMGSTTGCKTDTLTIAGVSGSTNRNGWAYRCVVTDAQGYIYTTEYAFLYVTSAQITSQPESQTAAAGSKAVFSVEIAGEVVSYQWQYSKDGGKSWYNSSSATQGYNTDTLTVGATVARNGFLYRCKITDSEGNVIITCPVQLTVQ